MSEQNSPALQSNPHWLMGEADLLRFDRHRGDARSAHGPPPVPPPVEGRARMLPSSGSGYEQILAARGELRTRAERAAAEERRASAEAAAAPAVPAAPRSLERPPGRPGGLNRRDRPALLVWGLLTAPAACVLVAFTWVGSPRPSAPSAATPAASRGSLPIAGVGSVASPPSANEGELVFAARDAPPHPWPDDAEPARSLEDVWFRPMQDGVGLEPAFVAPGGGYGPRTAEAGPEPAQEGTLFGALPSSPDMLPEEVRAAFATWDRHSSPWVADDGPDTGFAEGGPVSAASDRDAPAAEAGSGSGMPADGWAPLAVMGAAPDAEPTRDDPAETEAAAEVAFGPAPPSVPTIVGATEPAAQQEETRDVPASPVEEGQQAFAALPDPAAQPPEAAPSSAGTDTAAAAEASGGSSAGSTPRMAALVAPPPPPPPPPTARSPADGAPSPAKARLSGGASLSVASRSALQGDAPAAPSPDPRCRTIIVKAQLGEETSHAERLLLRNGCGARR